MRSINKSTCLSSAVFFPRTSRAIDLQQARQGRGTTAFGDRRRAASFAALLAAMQGRERRPFRLRESHKWTAAMQQAAARFAQAGSIIHVMDREADDCKMMAQLLSRAYEALQIILAMALKASTTALQLVAARDQREGFPLADVFDERQVEALAMCHRKYEGRELSQRNQLN